VWRRRRGRSSGLAIGIVLAAALAITIVAAASVVAGRDRTAVSWRLVVRNAGGVTLAQADLGDGRFALRYRNSVYGSRAEERFAILEDGRINLFGLAADEAAVLGEYYGAREPRPAEAGAAFRWEAAPSDPVVLDRLLLAATDLGERTLIVDGRPPIDLWRLVPDSAPGVSLGAERVP
jgi:hypothetical protein